MPLINTTITTILFLFTALGCTSNRHDARHIYDNNKVREITIAIEIFGSDYVFSDAAIVNLGGLKYLFRQKAIYGKNGGVQKLLIYKPDGALEYNEYEILNDTKLMTDSGLPVFQDYRHIHNALTDENGKLISCTTWVSDSIYKAINGRYTIFYKIE